MIKNALMCVLGKPHEVKVGQHLPWAHDHTYDQVNRSRRSAL